MGIKNIHETFHSALKSLKLDVEASSKSDCKVVFAITWAELPNSSHVAFGAALSFPTFSCNLIRIVLCFPSLNSTSTLEFKALWKCIFSVPFPWLFATSSVWWWLHQSLCQPIYYNQRLVYTTQNRRYHTRDSSTLAATECLKCTEYYGNDSIM